ncbi:MAG: hypothetical protein EPO00_03430 [Chloroflexota bacterium]|nr:MAG: hypothetical protein EPO00_03430 [Chloroflexota bacterium]
MTLALSWVTFSSMAALALIGGLAFRRGRFPGFADRYHNTELPAVWRNLPLVVPFVMIAMLPMILFIAPTALNIDVHLGIPDWVLSIFVYGGMIASFTILGISGVLAVRPPRWLIPRWLREVDTRIGFHPPKLDWFDWFVVALALAMFVAAGAVMVLWFNDFVSHR